MVRSEVGILDELDMPPSDSVPVLARTQAFRQGLFHLTCSH